MRTWLKEERTKKDVSIEECAKELGVTPHGFYLIERGDRRKHLPIATAKKLAKVLGLTLDDIARFEGVGE